MIDPFGTNIIIENPTDSSTRSASGLYIPGRDKSLPYTGTVLAIGETVTKVKVGEKIVYKPYASFELLLEKREFVAIDEADVIGVVRSSEKT